MREFDVDLTAYITKGITPNRQHVTQTPGLYDCKELIVAPDGLRVRPSIFALDPTYGEFNDYPFPMLFNNIDSPVIANSSGLFDYTDETEIVTSEVSEIVDFNKFIVINSDAGIIEMSVDDGIYTDISPVSPSYLDFKSVCKYNDAQGFGVLGKWLYWSRIGEFDFTIDNQKIAGKMPMPFPGDGLRVMQLSNHMICYGDEGVFALSPVQQPMGAWRMTKFKQLNGIGLKSFFAVCDIGDAHLFVGNDDNLWKLNADLKMENLGYDYLLEGVDEPNCSFVAMYGCTYISDVDTCYVYTSQGLSRVQHYSRSVIPYYGEGYKIAGYPNVSTGYETFEVTTLPIDFKLRAVKHIQAIEVDVRSDSTVECAIDWRSDMKNTFRSTGWVRLNPAGIVQIPCSGVDFRIKLRGQLDDKFYIASLTAKIKYENKTTLRGKYAR